MNDRSWIVRSNSFGANYEIAGQTLPEAIMHGLEEICEDLLPKTGGWKPISVSADWRADIFGERGGVEIVVAASSDLSASPTNYVAWAYAAANDLRDSFFAEAPPGEFSV